MISRRHGGHKTGVNVVRLSKFTLNVREDSNTLEQRNSNSLNVYFVAHRYSHHAGPSGYDRFADYLGERIAIPDWLRRGEKHVLKLPAKIIEMWSGVHEYRRPDVLLELAALAHLRKHRNAIYHVLYGEKSLFLLSGLNSYRGHKIVATFHHCPSSYPERYRDTSWLKKIEHAVVVSRSQIAFVESLVGKGKVTFVPYAVDAEYFIPAKRESVRLRCTCAGAHLRDFKTLATVIRAVTEKVKTVDFYVIGAPPEYENEFRALRGVVWQRKIPDSEYLDVMQQTDVLVLPLHDSTSVTSVNEALACGVPIVTSSGGVEDYLDASCSFVHAAGEADGFIDSTIRLLREEELRKAMRAAARRRGELFHWPRSAEVMKKVYAGLVNRES